ncbi:MAG: hypothetical protein GY861_13125 [bacterium]|nr:hypothetical protein [bacterium]
MKSEKGVYVGSDVINYRGRAHLPWGRYRYNKGATLTPTFTSGWMFMEGVETITSVEEKLPTKYVNIRWELIDKEDNPINLPEVLRGEDVKEWWDDDDDVYDYCFGVKSPYYKYRTFYQRKKDVAPEEWKEVEFTVKNLGTILQSEVDNFSDMKIVVGKTGYQSSKPNTDIQQDLSKIVTYAEIEKMLVPDLALHNRPCSVSADTTYKIIRNHIKDNIDGKYARVTSDYDFCFTVNKRVRVEPYTYQTEIKKANGRSYARPRFNTHKVEFKEVEIFEMCPSKVYRGYTPIAGFKGESLSDLAENIKLYLTELMEVINLPVHECSHCNGKGAVVKKVEDKNKRGDV